MPDRINNAKAHAANKADTRYARCIPATYDAVPPLRSHIDAMGGEVEVVAKLTDGTVKISNFASLDGKWEV